MSLALPRGMRACLIVALVMVAGCAPAGEDGVVEIVPGDGKDDGARYFALDFATAGDERTAHFRCNEPQFCDVKLQLVADEQSLRQIFDAYLARYGGYNGHSWLFVDTFVVDVTDADGHPLPMQIRTKDQLQPIPVASTARIIVAANAVPDATQAAGYRLEHQLGSGDAAVATMSNDAHLVLKNLPARQDVYVRVRWIFGDPAWSFMGGMQEIFGAADGAVLFVAAEWP
jgi:hypothetical protein